MLAGLHDILDAANAGGGIHGRTLILTAANGAAGGPRTALAQVAAEPIYALVGSLWPGSPAESEDPLSARRIPNVGSLVIREKAAEAGEWDLDLLPPLETQQQALEGALKSCPGERWGLAVTAPGTSDPAAGIRWVTRDRLDSLAQAPAGSVACLGLGVTAAADVPGLTASGWRTLVVLPFPAEILSARQETGERVSHWRRLGQASARLAVELLAEAGPALTERAMLRTAQALRGFKPLGDAPPVSFSRSRRFGWDPSIVSRSPDRMASP